jgi:hypothetical protein
MSSISTATAEWLALRARADDAARSAELARELARLVGPGPADVHDLGAGTGAMARWLAPLLPGPQRWTLRDGDAGILAHADLRSVADRDGRPIAAEWVVEDLAALPRDAFRGASAVTASALLDVITEQEAAHIVAACTAAGVPALFSLSVTGDVRLRPRAGDDAALERAIGAAFDAHQRRDADGRRMLGPDAVRVVAERFAAAGWRVRTMPTPWRLGAHDRALAAAWLDGWVDAAIEQRPDLAGPAGELRRRRRAQADAGDLRVVVGHEDLLAWPG